MATVPTSPVTAPEGALSFQDGLGIRHLATDEVTGDRVERLCVSYELAKQAAAIRERVSRLVNFKHPRFPRLRGVEVQQLQVGSGVVWVLAEPADGVRLFDLLVQAERGRLVIDVNTALQIAREVLPALATLHDSRSVTHGAIGPERLVLTRQARVMLVDHAFGAALPRLNYPRVRLWREFRIAMPASAGQPRFDQRADVSMVAMTVLAALLGRPITLNDFPDQVRDLLDRARERPVTGRDRPLSASLRAWLERTLPLESRRPLATALEAQVALEEAIKKERHYAPGASALKQFVERIEPLFPRHDAPAPVLALQPPPPPEPVPPVVAARPAAASVTTARRPGRVQTPEEEEAEEIAFLEKELARLALEEAAQNAAAAGLGTGTETGAPADPPAAGLAPAAAAVPPLALVEPVPAPAHDGQAATAAFPMLQGEPLVEIIAEVPLHLDDSRIVEFSEFGVDTSGEEVAGQDATSWCLTPPSAALAGVEDVEADEAAPPVDRFTLWLDFERMDASALLPAQAASTAVSATPARRSRKASRLDAVARAVVHTPLARAVTPLARTTRAGEGQQAHVASRHPGRRVRRKSTALALPERVSSAAQPLCVAPHTSALARVVEQQVEPLSIVSGAHARRRARSEPTQPAALPSRTSGEHALPAPVPVKQTPAQVAPGRRLLRFTPGVSRTTSAPPPSLAEHSVVAQVSALAPVRTSAVAAAIEAATEAPCALPIALGLITPVERATPAPVCLIGQSAVTGPFSLVTFEAIAADAVVHDGDAVPVAQPAPVNDTAAGPVLEPAELPVTEEVTAPAVAEVPDADALASAVTLEPPQLVAGVEEPPQYAAVVEDASHIDAVDVPVPEVVAEALVPDPGPALVHDAAAEPVVEVAAWRVTEEVAAPAVAEVPGADALAPAVAQALPQSAAVVEEPPQFVAVVEDAPRIDAVDVPVTEAVADAPVLVPEPESALVHDASTQPVVEVAAWRVTEEVEAPAVAEVPGADALAPAVAQELPQSATVVEEPPQLVAVVEDAPRIDAVDVLVTEVVADTSVLVPEPQPALVHDATAEPVVEVAAWRVTEDAAAPAVAEVPDADALAPAVAQELPQSAAVVEEPPQLVAVVEEASQIDAVTQVPTVEVVPRFVPGEGIVLEVAHLDATAIRPVAAPEPPPGPEVVDAADVDVNGAGVASPDESVAPVPADAEAVDLDALMEELRAIEDAESLAAPALDSHPTVPAAALSAEPVPPLAEVLAPEPPVAVTTAPAGPADAPAAACVDDVAAAESLEPRIGAGSHVVPDPGPIQSVTPASPVVGQGPPVSVEGLADVPRDSERRRRRRRQKRHAPSPDVSLPAPLAACSPAPVEVSHPAPPAARPAPQAEPPAPVQATAEPTGEALSPQLAQRKANTTGREAWSVVAMRPEESHPIGGERLTAPEPARAGDTRESAAQLGRTPLAASGDIDASLPNYAPWLTGVPLPPGAAEATPRAAVPVNETDSDRSSVYAPEPVVAPRLPAPAQPPPAAPAARVVPFPDVALAPPRDTLAAAEPRGVAKDRPATPVEAPVAPRFGSTLFADEGNVAETRTPPTAPPARTAAEPSGRAWRRTLAASVAAMLVAGAALAAYWLTQSAPTGVLVVQASVNGIEVLVDGHARGHAPLQVDLPAGRHTIEMRGLGTTKSFPVEIVAGVSTTQSVKWPAPGQATGSLHVTSTPPGARVIVDGETRGMTPVVIEDLSAGVHTVMLESEAGSVKRTVKLEAGTTASVDASIFAGWLQVFAPFKVTVFAKGRPLGSDEDGKLMLPSGTHQLELVNESLGFRLKRAVDITPGGTTPLSIEAPRGSVDVDAPEGTEVWIDGELRGVTPLAPVGVTVGTREIVLRHPQHGQRRRVQQVGTGGPTHVAFN